MYLLDTDICSYLMKRTHPGLIERIRGFAPRDLKISVITYYELRFGARRSSRFANVIRVIDAFLKQVEILPFDIEAAEHAGDIRATLTASGSIIGAYDLLIAGHARSIGATLITNNIREFSRVHRLEVENWAASK